MTINEPAVVDQAHYQLERERALLHVRKVCADRGLARLHTLQQIVAEHLAAQVFAGTAAGQSTVMGSAPASIVDDGARSHSRQPSQPASEQVLT